MNKPASGIISSSTTRSSTTAIANTTARHAHRGQPFSVPLTHSKVTREHLRNSAVLYVRQSTSAQLRDHQESTQRQYQLVHRVEHLGWPSEQITGATMGTRHKTTMVKTTMGTRHMLRSPGRDWWSREWGWHGREAAFRPAAA